MNTNQAFHQQPPDAIPQTPQDELEHIRAPNKMREIRHIEPHVSEDSLDEALPHHDIVFVA